jgi:hypothetical protein
LSSADHEMAERLSTHVNIEMNKNLKI